MSSASSLRFVLLQARNQGDPAAAAEHCAFAARLGVDLSRIQTIDVLHRTLGRPILDMADVLLVGGAGEYSVLDPVPALRRFIDFISAVADGAGADRPVPLFASCFGFQALVVGLGGTVVADPDKAEVGSYELELTAAGQRDPLFSALPRRFIAQLGHKDRAATLPDSVRRLASSPSCPHQAFTLPGRPVYATQFHPELSWQDNRARFKAYFDQYGRLFGPAEAQRRLDGHRPSPAANALLRRFVDQVVSDPESGG